MRQGEDAMNSKRQFDDGSPLIQNGKRPFRAIVRLIRRSLRVLVVLAILAAIGFTIYILIDASAYNDRVEQWREENLGPTRRATTSSSSSTHDSP
jgi:hypothetical protein